MKSTISRKILALTAAVVFTISGAAIASETIKSDMAEVYSGDLNTKVTPLPTYYSGVIFINGVWIRIP